MAPTLADLDARSRHWPLLARLVYLTIKWSLVSLGAAALTYHVVKTWGGYAAAWFLLAPLAWGLYLGLTARRPGQP